MPKWSATVKRVWKNEDARGWILWGAATAALLGPCLWLMFNYTYSTMTPATKTASAAFVAAILGGVVSWGTNETLFRLRKRRAAAEKKRNRKKGGAR